jgi:predicted house-cleaning noncanonical NTP pyrophosphatase (MazG superfamily)
MNKYAYYFAFISAFFLSCTEQSEAMRQAEYQNKPVDAQYQSKLLAAKSFYPFALWKERYDRGLTQYTQENRDRTKNVFDDLIDQLISAGDQASEAEKIQLFKTAILRLNKLNEEVTNLIETEEREELWELTNKITTACGLDPQKYGDGEGLSNDWREW